MKINMKIFVALLVIVLSGHTLFAQNNLVHRDIHFTTVPRIETSPKLDGDLSDRVWDKATQITGFVKTAGNYGELATHQTIAHLAYTNENLYIAFHCNEPDTAGIKTTCTMTDDQDILFDDRVEVFLDINHDHRSYIELAVNPDGVQFDQTGFNRLHGSKTCDMDPGFNTFWRAKTQIRENYWNAEIQINLKTLGFDAIANGTTWGLNLARVRQPDVVKGDEFFKREPAGPAEYSAWAPVKDYIRETISNFHAPIEFGDMVFGSVPVTVNELAFRSALYAFGPVGHPSLYGHNPLLIKMDSKIDNAVLKLTVEPETMSPWISEETVNLTSGSVQTSYFIPENQENKIIIQLFDPQTREQIYKTSYVEIAPPFIEFNLYSLYTRNPKNSEPVTFKLRTDDQTRSNANLKLRFKNPEKDELIEEVKLHNLRGSESFSPVFNTQKLRNLPGGNYHIECQLTVPGQNIITNFTQPLTKFANELPDQFSAIEGDYSYAGITSHAIRVRYPFAAEFVFWRDASYIPIWDIEQAAMTNEFVECWGGGNQGCNEPMQDRECRYSSVELLENSPARVVVHWRYALSDPHYNIYRNEWVDEYYTLYPDGVGAREVNLWPNSNTRHEMFEVLLIKPPMVHTEQMYDDAFATLTNLKGESYSNKEFTDNKQLYKNHLASDDDFIIKVHFRDRMNPFAVFSFRDELLPGVSRDHVSALSKEMASADQRGHWPASRYQIDGYNTVGLDVPNHGNIGNIQAEVDADNQPQTWTFLIGVMKKGSDKAQKHARSWLYPAHINTSADIRYSGFEPAERAYVLHAADFVDQCQITLTPRKGVTNPVFRIKNPGAELDRVRIGEKTLSGNQFSTGRSKDNDIIIFIKGDFKGKKVFTFTFNKAD